MGHDCQRVTELFDWVTFLLRSKKPFLKSKYLERKCCAFILKGTQFHNFHHYSIVHCNVDLIIFSRKEKKCLLRLHQMKVTGVKYMIFIFAVFHLVNDFHSFSSVNLRVYGEEV